MSSAEPIGYLGTGISTNLLLLMSSLPNLNQSLPIALIHAREHAMAPIREMLADSEITEQQWRVLRVLEERGRQDATTISEHACLMISSLTRILRGMDQRGLIKRCADKEDRRRQWVEIAPYGQEILDENRRIAYAIAEEFRARLGEDEADKLIELLNRFSNSCKDKPITLANIKQV